MRNYLDWVERLREFCCEPGLLVFLVLFTCARAALWTPAEVDVYACAAAVPPDAEGQPRPHIPTSEWEERRARCRACLVGGGSQAECAGGGR